MIDFAISFITYLSVFGVTIVCFSIAEDRSFYNKNSDILGRFLLIIGILIPCIFAGIRDIDVGRDTHNYYYLYEMTVPVANFEDVLSGIKSADNELGFKVILYVLTRFSNNPFWLLFLYQLLTVVPLVVSVHHLNGAVSLPFAMATYLFCFFNNSLNIVRQSAAASFLICGTVILFINPQTDKLKTRFDFKGIICLIISLILHKFSFICCAIIIVIYFVSKSNYKNFTKVFLLTAIIAIMVSLPNLLTALNNYGLLSHSMQKFADVFVYKTNNSYDYFINPFSQYSLTDIFCRLLLIVPAFVHIKQDKNTSFNLIRNIVLYGFIIYIVILFMFKSNYGQRIAMDLDMCVIIYIPYAAAYCDNIKSDIKIVEKSAIILYWVIWIMYEGWSASRIYSIR